MSVDPTYLQKFACFQDLSGEQRKSVAELVEAKCFYPEYTLFEENDPGDFLYLLAEGEVEVLYSISESGPTRVDQVVAEEIVGCSALVPPYVYTSTTRSLTEIEVLMIDVRALRDLMREDCPLGFSIQQHFMRVLMDRVMNLRLGS